MSAEIAVIVPCYDLGRTLQEAVDSVLAQTRPAAEIVVVDDGSTDAGTCDVLARLQRPRTKVVRIEHGGVARARDHGVGLTQTPYLVFLDADDRLQPSYLEKAAARLDADPGLSFVSCAVQAFEGASYLWKPPSLTLIGSLTHGSVHMSTMFRRSLWNAVGGFDPTLPAYEDLDFWLRALALDFRGEIIDEPLLLYRVRPDSRYRRGIEPEPYLAAMTAILDKHRTALNSRSLEVLRDKEAFIVELATYNRGLKQERDRLLQTQQNSQKTPEVETKLLSARQSTGAIILAYHRIAALQPDTHDLCVQPDSFRQQVRYLHEACRPMRLEDLYRAATDGKLPPRAVALSFDDGTLDALTTAAPILQDAGVPGTFFVNSERLEEKHEAWHDTVERVLLSGPLPAQLKLILPDQEIMLATETREQRLQALRTVHGPLMLMLPDERAEVTAQIVAWSGRQMPPRDSHRLLLADEIRQLARVPGCRVGSHSANHLLLTGHTAEVQRDQVLACKHRLEEITQRPALAFSYPYGESSPELAHLVRTAGHPLAVTVNPGLVTATSDPMHLPRHLVRECPLSDFIAQIEQAFKELPEPGAHEAAQ